MNDNNRELLTDPKNVFAGYIVPHPLKHDLEIKIQTRKGYTPEEALKTALKQLHDEIRHLESKFVESNANFDRERE